MATCAKGEGAADSTSGEHFAPKQVVEIAPLHAVLKAESGGSLATCAKGEGAAYLTYVSTSHLSKLPK